MILPFSIFREVAYVRVYKYRKKKIESSSSYWLQIKNAYVTWNRILLDFERRNEMQCLVRQNNLSKKNCLWIMKCNQNILSYVDLLLNFFFNSHITNWPDTTKLGLKRTNTTNTKEPVWVFSFLRFFGFIFNENDNNPNSNDTPMGDLRSL